MEKYNLGTIIIYNGDFDTVCNFIGDEEFVDSFGYKLLDPYQAWSVDGRVGGWVKRYEGITFTTVRAAGHMVPGDQPKAALEVIKELIGKGKMQNQARLAWTYLFLVQYFGIFIQFANLLLCKLIGVKIRN